jgi:hypothetical protein
MHTNDLKIPVKRLQLDRAAGVLVEAPLKKLFLRGPIPMEWLSKSAELPGKTLHLSIALWWLHGMANGKPFKLTKRALDSLNVSRDAAGDGLVRLEQQGLISIVRKVGQRPTITVLSSTGNM